MILIKNILLLTGLLFGVLLPSCVTDGESKLDAPKLTQETSTEDAVEAAINFGGQTFNQAMTIVKQRRDYVKASQAAKDRIIVGLESMKLAELYNAVRIYRESSQKLDRRLFVTLIFSELNLARQMGWQLAATFPSIQTGKMIDDALSLILAEGKEKNHFISQMASAVAANNLASSYKVLQRGLNQTGDDAFAKAMIAINPTQASSDFLAYLAMAPVEDLRQLNQQSVNVMTCYVILNHMRSVQPPTDHPQYEHLFLFAVSRNQGLAELARAVLEEGYTKDRARLAFVLARLPSWIQVSFVEGVRRSLNSNTRGFLAELRKLTVQDDVLEELKNISL